MAAEITLQEVTSRLESLEMKFDLLNARLETQSPTASTPSFEYIVFADEQEVGRGQKLYEKFPEILHKYPNTQISILWQPEQSFLWV